jgi:hypothetical protein
MSQNDSEPEVACTITNEKEAEPSEQVQATLIDHYIGYREVENGVLARFDGTDESLEALAKFISNELHCCSFAEYEITVTPPYNETHLRITGPDGTKELFTDGLVDRLEEESA